MTRTLASVAAALVVALPCAAQAPIMVRGPTAILFVDPPPVFSGAPASPHELADSSAAPLRKIAEREGFVFQVALVFVENPYRVLDTTGRILYVAPRSLHTGLLLIAPGREPQLIPHIPIPPELQQIIRDYRAGRVKLYNQPATPTRAA